MPLFYIAAKNSHHNGGWGKYYVYSHYFDKKMADFSSKCGDFVPFKWFLKTLWQRML